MDSHKISHKIWLLLAGLSVIFVSLACATLSKPTPSPQAVVEPTHTPDFQLTADYQSALATQLAATQTALQGEQIRPTLVAIYADQCTLPADQAGRDSVLQGLNIDLWPEYDRPSMLVIYRVTLASWLSLPAKLAFRIPARAGEPNAVAIQDSSGSLVNAAYTRTVEGEWATVTFTATTPSAQLEYYDPDLTRTGNSRQYEFQWVSDYSIANLLIRVRPSQQVTSMQITPGMAGPGLASDGTLYMCSRMGPLTSNTPVSFTIDYQVGSGP